MGDGEYQYSIYLFIESGLVINKIIGIDTKYQT